MINKIQRLQNLIVDWPRDKEAVNWAIDQLRWRRVEDELPELGFFDKNPGVGIEWLMYYSISDDPVFEVETKYHGIPDEQTSTAVAWRPVDLTVLPEGG